MRRLLREPIGRIEVEDEATQRALDEITNKVNEVGAVPTNIIQVGPWVESDLIGGTTLSMKMSAESSAGDWPKEWTAWGDGEVIGAIARITPVHATLDLYFNLMHVPHEGDTEILERILVEFTDEKGLAIPQFENRKATFKRGESLYLDYNTPSGWTDNTNHASVFLLLAMKVPSVTVS